MVITLVKNAITDGRNASTLAHNPYLTESNRRRGMDSILISNEELSKPPDTEEMISDSEIQSTRIVLSQNF
jgi:hypothetical protein